MKHFVFTEHCTMTTLSCLNAVSQKEVNNDEALSAAYRNAGLGGIRCSDLLYQASSSSSSEVFISQPIDISFPGRLEASWPVAQSTSLFDVEDKPRLYAHVLHPL